MSVGLFVCLSVCLFIIIKWVGQVKSYEMKCPVSSSSDACAYFEFIYIDA